jgi:hypothetical protein
MVMISISTSLVLNVVLVIGGILVVQLRGAGMVLLRIYAWAELVYHLYSICVEQGYQLHWYGLMGSPAATIRYVFAMNLELWSSTLVLPIIVLVLLSSRGFREAFVGEHSRMS